MEFALTICQPWAWAIVDGPKRWENRSWPLPRKLWGQRVWIHAGKSDKWMAEGLRFLREQGVDVPQELSFGAVLGRVLMPYSKPVGSIEPADPFAFGEHCWRCDEPERLAKPQAVNGQQGIWQLSADVAARCLEQLASSGASMDAAIDVAGDGRSRSGGNAARLRDMQGHLWS